MSKENFFDESSEQSQVKTRIISKYFWAWAKVIISTAKKNRKEPRIAYIDLFAGPGRYNDGTISTPILILEKAIKDEDLCKGLVTVFNDKEKEYANSLEVELSKIPGIEKLKFPPAINNNEVGGKITKIFEEMRLIPTLFFVDPWGYKGLSLRLVNSVLKDWGCDCVFFFNYNRINMGLNNPSVKEHIDALFGEERGESLRKALESLNPIGREMLIVENLIQALKDFGGKYVLPFCFKNGSGKRTSHHLMFISKHFKGYEIMKEIMASESTLREQGVPTFIYNPADINYPLLFEYNRPLDELESLLLNEYNGRAITLNQLYHEHSIGRRFIKKNYKFLMIKLEQENKIFTNPAHDTRKKYKGEITFGDDVNITFPKL